MSVHFSPASPLHAPVLMVDGASSSLLEPTCGALAAAGFRSLHMLGGLRRTSARWSHRLQSFTASPPAPDDEPAFLETLFKTVRTTGAQVLLPVGTNDVRLLARHRDQLPPGVVCVPMPDAALLDELTDKLRFTRFMSAQGFALPRTFAVTPALTADEAATLKYPVIAKPNVGQGGAGCRRLADRTQLEHFLRESPSLPPYHVQEFIPGEDVYLTMLSEAGEVFAVAARRRWLHRPDENPFSPEPDLEFFDCDWLEEMLRSWIRQQRFSGVADFDLRVDFAARRATFLECDPRMMGSQRACLTFGVNMAALLCRRALGEKFPCVRAQPGRFLSLRSLPAWLKQRGWRDRARPVRTGLRAALADPFPPLARRLRLG